MINSPVPAYVFGPFRLLPLERVLFEGDRALRLGSRAMDLLLALLERAGDIVDKHELVTIVWPHAVVDDATLRVHLAALRKALGDGRDGQRYITTIPGRGYGFLAPLALATALGVAVPAGDPMPSLLAYLRQRHMLIVLDNCEHVIGAAALLADALLKGAPLLHLLATSREPLRISSEHLQRLPALGLPPADVVPDAQAARHFAAVQLFCERCAAADDSTRPGIA